MEALKMKRLIEDSIRAHSRKRTAETLGDRRLYIGASDLASANGCLRGAAVMKFGLDEYKTELSFQNLLSMHRGHAMERGLFDALLPWVKGMEQLTIEFMVSGIKHQFHLDLVILREEDNGFSVDVFENKTSRQDNPELQDSYVTQIKVQLAALDRYWDTPSFSVRNDQKKMSFPELCRVELGIVPNKVIEGFVPVTSTKDKFEVYGEYLPPDEEFWRQMMSLSRQLYNSSFLPGGAKFVRGFYALCDFCPGQFNCPKFSAVQVETPDKTLKTLKKVEEAIELLVTEEKKMKESLKQYYQLATKTIGKAHIECPTGKFRVITSSREYYTKERIRQSLGKIGLSGEAIDNVLADAVMRSEPSLRLNIVWSDKGKKKSESEKGG